MKTLLHTKLFLSPFFLSSHVSSRIHEYSHFTYIHTYSLQIVVGQNIMNENARMSWLKCLSRMLSVMVPAAVEGMILFSMYPFTHIPDISTHLFLHVFVTFFI